MEDVVGVIADGLHGDRENEFQHLPFAEARGEKGCFERRFLDLGSASSTA